MLENLLEEYGTAYLSPRLDLSDAIFLVLKQVTCYKVESSVISVAAAGIAAADEGVTLSHHGEFSERGDDINRRDISWPENASQFICGPTIWTDFVFDRLNNTNNKQLIGKINSSFLHAACLAYHTQDLSKILKSPQMHKEGKVFSFSLYMLAIFAQRISYLGGYWLKYNKILNFLSNRKVIRSVVDIEEVVKHV